MKRAILVLLILGVVLPPSTTLAQCTQPDLNTLSEQVSELRQQITLLITELEEIRVRLEVVESKLGIGEAPKTSPSEADLTVYITRTGKKYHRITCRHVEQSRIPIKRSDAIANGYTPCRVCSPP